MNLKNSNESANNTKKTRICDKCGETKPLDADHYQPVNIFVMVSLTIATTALNLNPEIDYEL